MDFQIFNVCSTWFLDGKHQLVQVCIYDEVPFGIITKFVNYPSVTIFKYCDYNKFHHTDDKWCSVNKKYSIADLLREMLIFDSRGKTTLRKLFPIEQTCMCVLKKTATMSSSFYSGNITSYLSIGSFHTYILDHPHMQALID